MTGMVSNRDLLNWIASYCVPDEKKRRHIDELFASTEDLPRTRQTPPFLESLLRGGSVRDQAGSCVFLRDELVHSLFIPNDVKIRVSWSPDDPSSADGE